MAKSGFIAIIGRPNAGKSTLLNEVLGTDVSIVTPKAQTTRNRVLGILTEPEGQIVFVDTPGVHRAKDGGINEFMVSEAKEALQGPSLIWYLVDPFSALHHELAVIDLIGQAEAPIFLVMNKTDLLGKKVTPENLEKFEVELKAELEGRKAVVERVFRISAREAQGTKELLKSSWTHIEEGPRYFEDPEQVSDRPTRFFVAEMIREQLLLKLGEEVPYSCAVEIEVFNESAKPPRIEAVIHVERESQKGIVVGKGGQKIKEIGQAARERIEAFLGYRVFLGLRVKLLKDWTRDRESLKRMGYNLP
ncbi:MAG: GTPase Era [Bdellovibrionales bacterium GWB1_55_8]|nr:MAG: GTPase Era [Bdellovibrionales bacterium GWB1_55_8]